MIFNMTYIPIPIPAINISNGVWHIIYQFLLYFFAIFGLYHFIMQFMPLGGNK
jgi:hypothetical protein